MKTKIIKSKSAQETLMIGEKIASELKGNEIILLFGELGSGKTTLSQGLIKGLGYEGWPRSPSFVIVKEYEVNIKSNIWIFIDWTIWQVCWVLG